MDFMWNSAPDPFVREDHHLRELTADQRFDPTSHFPPISVFLDGGRWFDHRLITERNTGCGFCQCSRSARDRDKAMERTSPVSKFR